MIRASFYLQRHIIYPSLGVLLFAIILHGQEVDTSVTISHFMYLETEDIPIILDEGGENSFFLDRYNPRMLNDYRINHIMIDGALNLPQGSYFLPALIPKGMAPDSIHNYSQIHYQKGDYNAGELGLALLIEGNDSSFFTLQAFRQSPPIYLSSSWDDNLQNYLISYEHLLENSSLSVDVMYHLEDYHLPIDEDDNGKLDEYGREAESFHGGFGFQKNWNNLKLDFHPAFQITHANRQDSVATYITIWNHFSSRLDFGDHVNLSFQQESKMIIAEKENQLSRIEMHIIHPKLRYHSGGIMLEGGGAIVNSLFEPEGKISWQYKNLLLVASREFHAYIEPVHMAKYSQRVYSINTINIGYINKPVKVMLELYQVMHSDVHYSGILGKMEMDYPWLTLSQRIGIYDSNSDNNEPLNMFNHLLLLFSPNVWPWRISPYQPFIGIESIYIQHSGRADIDPTKVPIIYDESSHPYTSHLFNMEFGVIVSRFKVSSRWINLLGESTGQSNSPRTRPIEPLRQLEVVWQFWN